MPELSASIRKIAAMGMFRSGTNYLRAVMELNFEVLVEYNTFGWKHGLFPIVSGESSLSLSDTPLAVISKNPLSALDSLYRYFSRNDRNIVASHPFSNFLRSPIVIHDGCPGSNGVVLRFATPVDYYNSLYSNLLSAIAGTANGTHLRYEELLSNPAEVLTKTAATLRLKPKAAEKGSFPRLPMQRVKVMGDREPRPGGDFSNSGAFEREHYDSRRYLASFAEADHRYVATNIDRDVLARLGYERLEA